MKKLHYVSDGCSAQYKCFKNFVNLCHHKEDFGLAADWSFSASGHGKSACDGVGGTVKRLVARESLKRTDLEEQILTPSGFFEYARGKIDGITFRFISKIEMQLAREALIPRYTLASTVPGTRRYHFFEPQEDTASQCTIQYKELYIDQDVIGTI